MKLNLFLKNSFPLKWSFLLFLNSPTLKSLSWGVSHPHLTLLRGGFFFIPSFWKLHGFPCYTFLIQNALVSLSSSEFPEYSLGKNLKNNM